MCAWAPLMCLVPQECLLSMSDALELGLQVAVSLHVGTGIKPGASARAAANALNHGASSPVTTERKIHCVTLELLGIHCVDQAALAFRDLSTPPACWG